nr:unnamed protein product [Spirometra erinaceieuropaei]
MVVDCFFLLVLFSCGIDSGCVETIVEYTMQSVLLGCYSDKNKTWIDNGVWTFNNDNISRLAKQRVFQDGSLELYDLQHGHTGLYQCCSQDGLICSCVTNLTIESSSTVEFEPSCIAPTSKLRYRMYILIVSRTNSSRLSRSSVVYRHKQFHVESQEYACTDPVLRTVETRCFKTCLTILRPPANGLYRCHIRLLHLSESASWSFRPVYLIPGQETPNV